MKTDRAGAIAMGAIGAVVLGLALGFAARPNLGQPAAGAPMRAANTPTRGMDVEVSAPAPPPTVKPAGKLEVLPPDLARSVQSPVASMPADTVAAPIPVPRIVTIDPACGSATSRAAQMVCADPELAAADRELNRAYRRALRSGAEPDELRDEQRDWLAVRKDAARRSPRAVADVYERRIDELNRIADDGPA